MSIKSQFQNVFFSQTCLFSLLTDSNFHTMDVQFKISKITVLPNFRSYNICQIWDIKNDSSAKFQIIQHLSNLRYQKWQFCQISDHTKFVKFEISKMTVLPNFSSYNICQIWDIKNDSSAKFQIIQHFKPIHE